MKRRRVVLLASAGALATLGLCAVFHRPIVSHVVTRLALRDAARWSAPALEARSEAEYRATVASAFERTSGRYGRWLYHAFLDRFLVAREITAAGLTNAALPWTMVIAAHYDAIQDRFAAGRRTDDILDAAFSEFEAWLEPLATLPGAKELLVDLLVTSPWLMPGPRPQDENGLVKKVIFDAMFLGHIDGVPDRKLASFRARCAAAVTRKQWEAILAHAEHPREKVRAGSLLLLHCLHPSSDVVLLRARKGLEDPSGWVELAAAGVLALRGDDTGQSILIAGLDHERWEARFWSCFCLEQIPNPWLVVPLKIRLATEKDQWLRVQIIKAINVVASRR
jgi:hypothetical protein